MQTLIHKIKSNFTLKLALGTAVLSVLGLIAIYIIVNTVVRDAIYDNVVGVAQREQYIHADEIDAWFGMAIQTIDNLGHVLRAMPPSSYFASLIEQLTEGYDFINNIFIGFPDGSSINGLGWVPDEDWALFERDWYIAALAEGEGEIAVLDAFWSQSGQAVVSTLSTWLPDVGEDGIVLGFSITLDYILDRVSRHPVMGDGYLFLIGENGRIITHPEPRYAIGPDIEVFNIRDDIEGGGYLMDNIKAGVYLAQIEDARLGRSHFIATPLDNINWTLITIIPVGATEAIIANSLRVLMISFALFILALFIVIMFFVSNLTRSEAQSRANLRAIQLELEAAEKIKEEEERWRSINDASPVGITFWDGLDSIPRLVDCNKAAHTMVGIDDKDFFLKNIFTVAWPEYQPNGMTSAEMAAEVSKKTLELGKYPHKWMFRTVEGEPVPTDATTVVFQVRDKLMGASFFQDLRAVNVAMERERDANELNEIFMKNSPLVMNIWDEATNMVSTSQQAVDMFGLDSMEQYIERFFDLSPEYQPCGTLSRDKAHYNNQKAFSEGSARFEWMHQTLNGEPIPTEIILQRFTRQGKHFLVAFTIDLRFAKALHDKEMNERIQLMFDATPLIVEYWDAKGNLLDCNQTALDYYGHPTKEKYLLRVMENFSSWDIWNKMLKQVFETGSASFTIEDPQPDGSVIFFEVEAVRVKRNNEFVAVTYAQDVTQLRKMQKEEKELLSRLEAAIDSEQAANSAKSRFLSNMSHEIRTPMSAIIGMAGIAKNTGDIKKKADCLDKIDKASKHLLGIINQILDISKIEAESFALDKRAFRFERMIDEVASVLSVNIDEKRLTFNVDLDKAIPRYIISDEIRLAQVLTNLLTNAVKFTPEGGAVSLTARLVAGDLRVEVSDTGIGVPEEMHSTLFGAFVQAETGTARKFGGTGLGLAISKQIVELMGGSIWLESKPDEGSRFIFTIPIEASENEDSVFTEPRDTEPDSFKGSTILVVEDVDINREIASALLEPTGIKIELASDGEQALRMFRDEPSRYDIIFMDVQMPGIDGITATRQLRGLGTEKSKTIPIIAMTANVFREDIDKCLEAGMNDHLSKPLDFSRVAEKLKLYLGRDE